VDGHAGRAGTSRPGQLKHTVHTAARIARDLARANGKPGAARVGGPAAAPELVLWHEDTEAFDAAARVNVAGALMRRAKAADGSAAGMIGRAVTQLAVATSGGVVRHALATEAGGSFTATVRDGSSHWVDLHRSSTALRIDDAVETALRRAMAGRGRVDLPDGTHTVVLGQEAMGDLLGFFGVAGFSGDLAAAGIGIPATRAGERIAAPLVTIADDALAPCGLPIPFDREGTPKRVVPFLTEGVVGEPVTDLATAAALGRRSTGHAHLAREEAPAPAPANVVMSAGTSTEAELIAGVERGVYLERFWYTRLVDRPSATITGVSRDGCFLIDNGVLGPAVAGARFTQSIVDFLSTVDGVADVQRSQPVMNVWNGAVSAPAVRGHGFRFGPRPLGDGR
jgi:predicted Zn-dependent protease